MRQRSLALEGLLQPKALVAMWSHGCLSWIKVLENTSQILDPASILVCYFSWSPHSSNENVDRLAKHRAKQMVSFVGDFFTPLSCTLIHILYIFFSYAYSMWLFFYSCELFLFLIMLFILERLLILHLYFKVLSINSLFLIKK